MTITTLQQIEDGELGYPFLYDKSFNNLPAPQLGRGASSWYMATGNPGAGATPSSGLAGNTLVADVVGQLPLPPVFNQTYFHSFTCRNYLSGAYNLTLICDRLWHNSGINITSTAAQTINSVAWPARDKNNSTNGDGVFIGVEVSGATGTGTPVLTINYTNQAGTAGRTATGIISSLASSVQGTFYFLGLQAGDTGVRSIQSFTLSATWTSGTIHLVAYRILATLPNKGVGIGGAIHDYNGMGLIPVHDDAVLFPINLATSVGKQLINARFTQG